MPSLIPSLRLMLCLMALAPSTILAAPVTHKKVTPPTPSQTAKTSGAVVAGATTTSSAHVAPSTTSSTHVATTSAAVAVDVNGIPIAAGADGPEIFTEDNNPESGLHIPTVEERSTELAAAIAADVERDISSLVLPITDETGDDAHILPVFEERAEKASSTATSEDDVPALVIPTEDDNSDCADNRGGCTAGKA